MTATDDEIDRVADILVEWFGHEEPTTRKDAADFLAEIEPLIAARLEQERDECRHESMSGDNPGESPTTWRCDSCTYWVYAHGVTKAHDDAVAARTLREAADDLALWLHEVNVPDDVTQAVCTWVRLRARADALTQGEKE